MVTETKEPIGIANELLENMTRSYTPSLTSKISSATPVGFTMHSFSGFFARGLAEAKHLAGAFIVPVP